MAAETFDIIIDFANLVQGLGLSWVGDVEHDQMRRGRGPVQQVATEITRIFNTPDIKEKIKDKRVNIKIIFSYSGQGSLKAFQTAVANRTQPEREKTYNDPNIGAINDAITNDLEHLPDDKKPGKEKGFSIDWIWAGKMTESYAKKDTEKNKKIKGFDCTAKPPKTPDDLNGYSKHPVHTCESPDDLLVIYYVAKALKESRDCIVISGDTFRSEYYLINGCIGAGKDPSESSIKDIIAKCKLTDLWTQPNNQPRFWHGNSRKWHVFNSTLSDYDGFYDGKFNYKQALESILSGNQFKPIPAGDDDGQNTYQVLVPEPGRPNHPPELTPESSTGSADDPGATCSKDDQLGPKLFSSKNQGGVEIDPETCDIIRSERAGADAAAAADLDPAAAEAAAVAMAVAGEEAAKGSLKTATVLDAEAGMEIAHMVKKKYRTMKDTQEIYDKYIKGVGFPNPDQAVEQVINSYVEDLPADRRWGGPAAEETEKNSPAPEGWRIKKATKEDWEASAKGQWPNIDTEHIKEGELYWFCGAGDGQANTDHGQAFYPEEKSCPEGPTVGGGKKTKRKKKNKNKRRKNKTRKNKKNKSRKNKTKKFKPKMPGAFGDNVTLQLEFPNKSIRWVWLVKIRDDDRFVIRSPKIGVLVRELKLKRDKDFGPEKLAPKGTKIFSKK